MCSSGLIYAVCACGHVEFDCDLRFAKTHITKDSNPNHHWTYLSKWWENEPLLKANYLENTVYEPK